MMMGFIFASAAIAGEQMRRDDGIVFNDVFMMKMMMI